MKQFRPIDYDIVFLSYDEPNAEKNYADLCSKVPWAKRVHGVEGSDAAHKACANISETERLIIIDGDNTVDKEFFNKTFDLVDEVDFDNHVISFTARNKINGLVYGNGGIKSWNKNTLLNMRTHENALSENQRSQVDFCWDIHYVHINDCFSEIHNNGSAQQAWRAGFREGVKMALNEGIRIPKHQLLSMHWKNLHRLYIWTMVGADVKNGLWAIYGARHGLYKTMLTDWDFVQVRDFEYLNNLWETEVKDLNNKIGQLKEEIATLGRSLMNDLNIPIAEDPLDANQSVFFKTVYKNPPRTNIKNIIAEKESHLNPSPVTEHDIVMITYNEPNAEENWQALKSRFPKAKRVDGVKGIHQAHIEAAKQCSSEMIWIVDGDAVIKDDFDFVYPVEQSNLDTVHVWRCENPVNGLIYGYGGVKLFPRQKTIDMDMSKPDMTTSISTKFKAVKEVANITAFNTDEFSAWKSAFRECAKLSSKVIDRQKDAETEERLDVWCTIGEDAPFGKYAIAGALAGRNYGAENKDNKEALSKINDFVWLREQFDATNA